MSTAELIDETAELLKMGASKYPDIVKLERAVDRARSRPTQSAEEIQALYEQNQDLESLREKARAAFIEPLGWIVSSAPFSLAALRSAGSKEASSRFMGTLMLNRGNLLGCADYFLDASGKPVGIIGFTKRSWPDCHAWATSQGLQADALPSWRGPGTLIAVLYTRHGYVPPQRVAP